MIPELIKFNGTPSREEVQTAEPLVTIRETEKEILLEAEMPGLRKEDITVDLEADKLTLAGRQHEESPKGFTVLYQERVPFEYRRTFSLGVEIDKEKIAAAYENGILTVTLPKSERVQPRKIAVL